MYHVTTLTTHTIVYATGLPGQALGTEMMEIYWL